MSHDFGLQTASGHLTVSEESKESYPVDVEARFRADAAEVDVLHGLLAVFRGLGGVRALPGYLPTGQLGARLS